ncbi:MYB DNA-binding domain-containing protein [Histoplasma ohiense]|nr:MYB DNA-binding domain-containing protein [Histoplasma ohiense (nom. inval.)]
MVGFLHGVSLSASRAISPSAYRPSPRRTSNLLPYPFWPSSFRRWKFNTSGKGAPPWPKSSN